MRNPVGIYYTFISCRHDFRHLWYWCIYAWRFNILVLFRRPHFLPISISCIQRPLNFHITPEPPTLPLSGCSIRARSSEVWSVTMISSSLKHYVVCGFHHSARMLRWKWWRRAARRVRWWSSRHHVLSWTSWTSGQTRVTCQTCLTISTTKFTSWHSQARYLWDKTQ